MSTYPPPPGSQPGDPYGQSYGQQQYEPYGQSYGQQQYDVYGQPVQQPAQPYGDYGYGQQDYGPYAQPQYEPQYEPQYPPQPGAYAPQPEHPQQTQQSQQAQQQAQQTQPQPQPRGGLRPNPYEELGRLADEPDPEPRTRRPASEPEADSEPEPPRRRRRRLRGCLAILVVLILGVGGVAAYVLGVVWKVGAYKLVPPGTFQNLASDPGNALARQMSAAAGDGGSGGFDVSSVSTAYSTHTGDKVPKILLVGVYGDVLVTDRIDTLWQAAAQGTSGHTGSVTQKTVESSGPLGGATQCAVVNTDGASAPACAWADHSTIAMVIFLGDVKATGSGAVDLTGPARQTLALRTASEVTK